MANEASNWPEGLSDIEALERLEAILLLGCEGNQDLTRGRAYKEMRKALLERTDLADVVPSFVRSQRDLAGFWAYIKNLAPRYEPRRAHTREAMRPLFERVEGLTKPPVPSTKWTGRRTASQQAQIVLSLAPNALAGVEALLDEQERPIHNGGPVEPERADVIELLKALHLELGELIRLAHAEMPLEHQLGRMKAARDRALSWMKSPVGFALGAAPLTGFSVTIGVGVYYLINAIAPEAALVFGGGATAAHAAGAAIQQRGSSSSP